MAKKKEGEVCYVCEGSCGAVISEEQYAGGLTKCGAKSCDRHGKPFTKKEGKKESGHSCGCC